MGYGRGYAPLDAGSQRQILENRASLLERELAALRDQLAGEKGE